MVFKSNVTRFPKRFLPIFCLSFCRKSSFLVGFFVDTLFTWVVVVVVVVVKVDSVVVEVVVVDDVAVKVESFFFKVFLDLDL